MGGQALRPQGWKWRNGLYLDAFSDGELFPSRATLRGQSRGALIGRELLP